MTRFQWAKFFLIGSIVASVCWVTAVRAAYLDEMSDATLTTQLLHRGFAPKDVPEAKAMLKLYKREEGPVISVTSDDIGIMSLQSVSDSNWIFRLMALEALYNVADIYSPDAEKAAIKNLHGSPDYHEIYVDLKILQRVHSSLLKQYAALYKTYPNDRLQRLALNCLK
jgi:hypothetical protein